LTGPRLPNNRISTDVPEGGVAERATAPAGALENAMQKIALGKSLERKVRYKVH